MATEVIYFWIDRFAETAVSGGFTTALALVCLVQYISQLAARRQFQLAQEAWQQQLRGLTGAISQVQQVHEVAARENELLRTFLAEENSDVALNRLLREFIPDGNPGFAAFLLAGPPWTLSHAIGLDPLTVLEVALEPDLLERLQTTASVALDLQEPAARALLTSLAKTPQDRIERLYLLRTSPPGEPLDGLLVTTSLPDYPDQVGGPLAATERVLAAVGNHIRQRASVSAQAQELELTREILELRSIVDTEFRTPQELAEEFVWRLMQVAEFDHAAVYLFHPRDAMPSLLVRRFTPEVFEDSAAWARADETLVRRLAAEADLQHHSRLSLQGLEANVPFTEAVTVPMQLQGTRLGLLSLARRMARPLSAAELDLLTWAADYLFDTILKTADRVLTEDRARRDALTGLANRHTFDIALDEQLRRTLRSGRECGLLLFDIDYFKSVNDRFGHLAGDEALRTFGRILRDCMVHNLRETDHPLAARYGGEELAVILPGVGLTGALRLAEEVRATLAATEIVCEGRTFRLTVSGGVAIAPVHSRSMRGLIAAADEALYAAKHAGRNCVHAARPPGAAHVPAAPTAIIPAAAPAASA